MTHGLTRPLFPINVAAGSVAVAIWTVILGMSLPRHYSAQHWDAAWVGLDIAEALCLLATAWASYRQRLVAVFFASVSAALLAGDGWFDCVTANRHERPVALGVALLVEFPAAIVLARSALRTLRLATGGGSLWAAPSPRP